MLESKTLKKTNIYIKKKSNYLKSGKGKDATTKHPIHKAKYNKCVQKVPRLQLNNDIVNKRNIPIECKHNVVHTINKES